MANWAEPQFTRSRVKAAGKRLRDGRPNLEDTLVLENWRASHAYVLNTFQTNLRRRASSDRIIVAQRLKRRPTILDKLKREPTMQLDTMHDIAGCRIIFENNEILRAFRQKLQLSKSQHERKNIGEDRYDYLKFPKPSGYRGIHDVYSYRVASSAGTRWNGLHVELQFRTIYQHAWATAVEAADLVLRSRIKFSQAGEEYKEFFRLCSEIIARRFENMHSCFPDMDAKLLKEKFQELEGRIGLFEALKNLKKSANDLPMKTNTILVFNFMFSAPEKELELLTFSNIKDAIEKYNSLEVERQGSADIVLVRAESAESVRNAFRNYFSDTQDFVAYIEEGLSKL